MAHKGYELRVRALSHLWRKGFALILKLGELDFHEFVAIEFQIQGLNEGVAETGFAQGESGLHALGKAFELANLRVGQDF
jgi:hypothetical protein